MRCCATKLLFILSAQRRFMTTFRFSLLTVLFLYLLKTSFAQSVTAPTEIKLEYWRSFAGVIKQEASIVDGKMSLWTRVMKGMSAEEQKLNTKSTEHLINPKELQPILDIFNDPRNREYFLNTAFDQRLDGSCLQITVTQNQFSIIFTSQDAFSDDKSPASALGRAAQTLFKLGELDLSRQDLY